MLTIAVQESPEATVLHCSGRIVCGDGTDILRRIAFAQRHKPELLIDLRQVRSIDASGLGALVDLWHWIHETGRRLKLLNPSARVREALRVTGLTSLLDIYDGAPCAPAKLVS